MILTHFLRTCNRNSNLILVGGLIAGICFTDLARYLETKLTIMIALLLFANAFRIGHKAAFVSTRNIGSVVKTVLVLQLALPLSLLLIMKILGWNTNLTTALVVMFTAASIGGSPNLTRLTGHDPAPALQMLIIGTSLLPLTAPIVFLFAFPDAPTSEIIEITLKLILLIAGATTFGFLARHFLGDKIAGDNAEAVDGATIVLMAVLVIGLMSELGPALITNLPLVFVTLAAAFIANFGTQIAAFATLRKFRPSNENVAISIVSGNRNMALFLAVLPTYQMESIMLFLACYQIPMYITPLVMRRIYSATEIKKGA